MGEEVQQIKSDAPVKADEGPKRFVEKGPHVVLDTKTSILFYLRTFAFHMELDHAGNMILSSLN